MYKNEMFMVGLDRIQLFYPNQPMLTDFYLHCKIYKIKILVHV